MTTEWTVAQTKAKLSEVINRAELEGPQLITKNGKASVVIVSVKEWERKNKRKGSLAEFFLSSPLRESGIDLERSSEQAREIDL